MFGVGTDRVVLLDNKSKILAKSHSIKELQDFNPGSGKYHDGLDLEFRGSKPWNLTMSSLENLKSVTAVLWDALDMDGRYLNNGTLRRDSFDFGKSYKKWLVSLNGFTGQCQPRVIVFRNYLGLR